MYRDSCQIVESFAAKEDGSFQKDMWENLVSKSLKIKKLLQKSMVSGIKLVKKVDCFLLKENMLLKSSDNRVETSKIYEK